MLKMACVVENCGDPARARGFCGKHYQRWRTHGDPLKVGQAVRRPHWRPAPPCTVDGCEDKHESRGLCNKHYRRWRTHGDPLKVAQPKTADSPVCVVDGCEGKHQSRGYCRKHYMRWQRQGDPHTKLNPHTGRSAPAPLCREDFGSHIKAARLAAGLSQFTAAGRAGLSTETVSQVEKGTRKHPRLSTLKGLAEALGIPLSELLASPDSTAHNGR